MIQNLLAIYERTINNCLFYEKENKKEHLLNEIGVLRGVAYCLESVGICPHTKEFFHMIDLQNELLKA